MLYLQCVIPRTQFKSRNRKMMVDIKPKKKCVSSDIDYLLALDIFSTWEDFYGQNKKQKKDSSQSDLHLEEEH